MYPFNVQQTNELVMDDAYWAEYPDVLTTAHLTKITRKKAITAWRWLNDGKLPGHEIAGSWVVYRSEVRQKIEGQPVTLPYDFLARYGDELSVEELAELLGKTPQTVYKWLKADELPGHLVNGVWLIFKHEVCQKLEETWNLPSSPPRN